MCVCVCFFVVWWLVLTYTLSISSVFFFGNWKLSFQSKQMLIALHMRRREKKRERERARLSFGERKLGFCFPVIRESKKMIQLLSNLRQRLRMSDLKKKKKKDKRGGRTQRIWLAFRRTMIHVFNILFFFFALFTFLNMEIYLIFLRVLANQLI